MKRILILGVLILMLSGMEYFFHFEEILQPAAVVDVPSENKAVIPSENTPDPIVIFCPRENCSMHLVDYIENAHDSIYCAFYELGVKRVIDALEESEADVKLVMESDNNELDWENIKVDDRSGLMHNKFCIFDSKTIWTGSFNPTENGDTKNNNNVIIWESKYLAENYLLEFNEMWNGEFGPGPEVKNPKIKINGEIVRNIFCPEDNCKETVLEELEKAEESIYFMTFSFTEDDIGDLLIEKFNSGVMVKGVFEASGRGRYSEYEKLLENEIDVGLDTNKGKLHHKVFIIDNETVITGSYNPTNNGNKVNDENVLVIKDNKVASRFLEEFEMVFNPQ